MNADVIISPDTQREQRLPRNHVQVWDWPPFAGEIPPFLTEQWDFTIFPVPLVSEVKAFSWQQFCSWPQVKVFADYHDETGWSRLNNLWEGVSTREILQHISLSEQAKFVMVHCEYGFTTSVSLAEFFAPDALFAFKHNNKAILPEHGFPVRLVLPRLFGRKSAKWVRGIEFMECHRHGFDERLAEGHFPRNDEVWDEG